MTTDRAEPQQPSDILARPYMTHHKMNSYENGFADGWNDLRKRLLEQRAASPAPDPAQEAAPVAEIDMRCHCDRCEARTKETYRLKATCTQCGWSGIAIVRKGDKPHRRCRECWTESLTLKASPPSAPVANGTEGRMELGAPAWPGWPHTPPPKHWVARNIGNPEEVAAIIAGNSITATDTPASAVAEPIGTIAPPSVSMPYPHFVRLREPKPHEVGMMLYAAPPPIARSAADELDLQLDKMIDQRDERDEVIDAILNRVLGLERSEWSSCYSFADAVDDVDERMTAIEAHAAPVGSQQSGSGEATVVTDAWSNVPAQYKSPWSYEYSERRSEFIVTANGHIVASTEDSEVAHAICIARNALAEQKSPAASEESK